MAKVPFAFKKKRKVKMAKDASKKKKKVTMAKDASASKKEKKVTMAQGGSDENGGSRSTQWESKRARSGVIKLSPAPDVHNLSWRGQRRRSGVVSPAPDVHNLSWRGQRKRSGGKPYRSTQKDPKNEPEKIGKTFDLEDLLPLKMKPEEIKELKDDEEAEAALALLELKKPRIFSAV